jgi:hypothetical protein
MLNFSKKKSTFILTDDVTMIKEYGASVPRDDQKKKRLTYVHTQLQKLVNTILGSLNEKSINKSIGIALAACFDDKVFPIKDIYFDMEVKRMSFDSFGRLE